MRTMRVGAFYLLTFVASGIVSAQASDFISFSNNSATVKEVILQGDATLRPRGVRLTQSLQGQLGGFWCDQKQLVSQGFETTFELEITNRVRVGADGIAFVIQSNPTPQLGFGGSNIGFGGLSNVVAVKFDTYHNGGTHGHPAPYLAYDELAIMAARPGKAVRVTNFHPDADALASVTNGVTFSDGRIHTAKIVYIPGKLDVYLDNLQQPSLSVALDLNRLLTLDQGRAWVGFTGSTGADSQRQIILSWSFNALPDIARAQSNAVTTSQSPATTQTSSTAPAPVPQPTILTQVVIVAGVAPSSPAPASNAVSTPVNMPTPSIAPASILGTWETTIGGANQGLMVLTFMKDSTFSGYGLRTGLTNLFTVVGDWQPGRNSLTGHWWEYSGRADPQRGALSGNVSNAGELKFTAIAPDGSTNSWTGAAVSDYSDLSGHWNVSFAGNSTFAIGQLDLTAFEIGGGAYPGVFEITGENSGKLIVSSDNRIFGYIRSPAGDGATVRGSFTPGSSTLRLETVDTRSLFDAAAPKR
jgi:hypothetical protein